MVYLYFEIFIVEHSSESSDERLITTMSRLDFHSCIWVHSVLVCLTIFFKRSGHRRKKLKCSYFCTLNWVHVSPGLQKKTLAINWRNNGRLFAIHCLVNYIVIPLHLYSSCCRRLSDLFHLTVASCCLLCLSQGSLSSLFHSRESC